MTTKEINERMFKAAVLAKELNISVYSTFNEHGPNLEFDMGEWTTNINYGTDEWEIEVLEINLKKEKDKKELRIARQLAAEKVWDTLDRDSQLLIKENIYSLKYS